MLYAIVAVIALIIDQAVKYWTTAHIVLNEGNHALIPGFIHLANVHNTGAAFSFIEGARWVFVALCAVFVAVLIYLLVNNIIKGRAARWMAVLVMAGAVGNCIDRIISGYVVDMFEFEFKIFGQQFPVFNVADIFITVCGIAFCVCILLEKPEDEKARRARRAAGGGGSGRTAFTKPAQTGGTQGKVTPFPSRSGRPSGTGSLSSDDPFAEWERYAASKNQGVSGPSGKSSAPRRSPSLDEPMSHVRPAPKPAEPPAPAKPQRPSVQPDTSAEPSYDLDDILAEFRDL